VKNLTNGYAMSDAGDQVTLGTSGVTSPATLRIVIDTQNVGAPSAEAVTLKYINSATEAIPTTVRVRWTLNMPLPGTYYIGAQLIDQNGTVNAWADCTINYTCWFHNCWQSYSDGSMNTYYGDIPGEGYAIAGEGNWRVAKTTQQYGFAAFFDPDPQFTRALSDNTDGTMPGHSRQGQEEDGVTMTDWLAGKKLVLCSLYWRDAGEVCSDYNEPVEILGFRVANTGRLSDRKTDDTGISGGCCAGYTAPLVAAGMSAPPAWRMGAPHYDWTGTGTPLGYYLKGDAGLEGYEWYKVSNFDTTSPNKKGLEVVASAANTWFCDPYVAPVPVPPETAIPQPYDNGGWTGHPRNAAGAAMSGAGRFAFGWLVEVSNAHIVNSLTVGVADCSSTDTREPRDINMTGTLDAGWFSKKLDNGLVYALANRDTSEVKAVVFSAFKVANLFLNPSAYGRDQGGGQFGPYIYVWKATYNGDCATPLDGCVDDADLLAFAAAFGNSPYNEECDFNFDANVDISDLLALALQWTNCIPGAPY